MDTLPAHAPVHVPLAEVDLAIEGMSCASCVRRVERALAEVPGVETASVNLATEQARVSGRGMDIAGLMEAVGRAGYAAKPVETAPRRPASPPLWPVVVAGAASLPLICGMAAEAAGARWMVPGWVQLVLASVVQFGPGARFYRGAWKALRSGAPDMDVLVALGTSAAWGLSLWALLHASPALYFDSSALIITLILLGKWLETWARGRTAAAIRALSVLRPETAVVLREGGERTVPAAALRVGDVVVVRPGERIPADGRVQDGAAAVDEFDADRREPAGGEGTRCDCLGRDGVQRRTAGDRADGGGERDHAGADRPAGGNGAGDESTGAAAGGSGGGGVRAGGTCRCRSNSWRMVDRHRQRVGGGAECRVGVGDCLSVCAWAGDADGHHGRDGRGSAARHSDQGRKRVGARTHDHGGGVR